MPYVFTSFSNLKFKNEAPHLRLSYDIQTLKSNKFTFILLIIKYLLSFEKSLCVFSIPTFLSLYFPSNISLFHS